jgi:hypothetical protein
MNRLHEFLLIGSINLLLSLSWTATSRVDKVLPTVEQSQVYGDFIESLNKTHFKFLSNKTFPLDLSSIGKNVACLRGIQLERPDESRSAIHSLGLEVLRGLPVRLVDAQQELAILKERDASTAEHGLGAAEDASGMIKDPGVLALSDIAFDTNHHFAVLKYVFLCGSHCNSGSILVLEKTSSGWTETRRPCTFAVNRTDPRE